MAKNPDGNLLLIVPFLDIKELNWLRTLLTREGKRDVTYTEMMLTKRSKALRLARYWKKRFPIMPGELSLFKKLGGRLDG